MLIPAVDSNAWLTMDCTGEAPFKTIDCTFTQLSVTRKSDAEVAAEVAKEKTDIASHMNEMRQGRSKACSAKIVSELRKDVAGKASDITEGRRKALTTALDQFESMCACKDDVCLVDAYLRMKETTAKTCHISSNAYTMSFTRMSKTKWVNQPKPSGICNVVTAVVLERRDDSGLLWTYTQTRLAVDDENALCKGFDFTKPLVFATGGASAIALDCSAVDASVF
ncbi:hypothetical protein [Corallococcus sp. CA047B]|uniref:hypothetical protein n=1 Tax=Corallococcus sp. CA047B TaxID=2316729 RepID=UPI0011C3BF50|nr:hypothetical protein [Corallococcus sp. CA047B]